MKVGITMSYVDPNFDTYSLDACARYGILDSDPCMYLKGTPSPYLTQYYNPIPAKPIQDTYTPIVNQNAIKGTMPWKKKALAALALVLAAAFVIKKPHLAKKIIPKKIREFGVNYTPKCVKNTWNSCLTKIKSWWKK